MTTAPVLCILFHFLLDRQAIEQMISADVFDREYNYTVKIMIQQMILLKAADDFPTLQKEISSSVENICLSSIWIVIHLVMLRPQYFARMFKDATGLVSCLRDRHQLQ